ncbi:class A beta-lactamase-related serine hydrolase [Chitinophaga silvatica]|uniref:Class A beta-lactamase-related serine hydrolase n=1 Tax=Chitinophaga silvatica TaxID=2282649 RepID=A0A3E1Y5H6_9BACT|nr:serine hydrolase domain-containing protein [Chitinophaga silvatica]RFS19989.1 class A beta-lactamase-related serine hydrolase [Chitinophaga silvatica]
MPINRVLLLTLFIPLLTCCTRKENNVIVSKGYKEIDAVLKDSVPTVFNGKCYTVIHVEGKAVYERGFGEYDGNTKLLIASSSKWLSAAVLMSLVDEGKLNLTDTIGKFLRIYTNNHKGHITIAQLLSHTSGFPGSSTQGYESNVLISLAQATDQIAMHVDLQNEPGTNFCYGGLSMQIAGRICEIVSKKGWKMLAAEKIFTPCGMTNTDYGITSNPQIAGGVRSTGNDYIKFLDMMMNKGLAYNGKQVLSESAVEAIEKGYIGNATIEYSPYPAQLLKSRNFYGLGNWRDVTDNNDNLIENSSPGLFGTHPWINRSKRMTGIVLAFMDKGFIRTAPTCLEIRKLARE